MSMQATYVFAVLAGTLGLFVWGRWRYDVVALLALLAVVIGGVVPAKEAFVGFGHPAVITVAAVLVLSRALQNLGMIGLIARALERVEAGPSLQVFVITALVAAMSGFMNNVGALALLLPVILQTAKRSGRAPGELMMPLAFGSLLGGLTTMIGTPPNIIVANLRAEAAGQPFSMFDFTPVGLVIAIAGVLFIGLYGWRLIPVRTAAAGGEADFDIEAYTTEVLVPPKSGLSGTAIADLLEPAGDGEVHALSIIRKGRKLGHPKVTDVVRINDHLLLEGSAEGIEALLHNTPLELVGNRALDPGELGVGSSVVEAVVTPGSRLIRRSTAQTQLEKRHGLHLLALARQGRPIREHLRRVRIRAGDVLLLEGEPDTLPETLSRLGCLPLVQRGLVLHRAPSFVPLAVFAAAIILGVSGLLSLPIAFTAAVIALVLAGQIRARDLYQGVDWPILVLLGAMVPVGMAMEYSGASLILANAIAWLSGLMPPWGVVVIVLVAAMVLSDVMNNAATAILMSQLSIEVAAKMGISADPLLMAVAVGASCAFLTPIGHQSNVLVMGPGGYRFGDYWRLGLALEIVIIGVAVPMILWIWPL